MKIALVHDWLVTYGGAERVLKCLIECYPDCEVFTLINSNKSLDINNLNAKKINTSFLQKLPFVRFYYRSLLPLMPIAIEQFDLSKFDVVVSCSHAVAKGIITGPNQIHICICFTPIRYAWDLQHQYLVDTNLIKKITNIIPRIFLHYIRIWDLRTAFSVDEFIAISSYIQKRIYKFYRRESIIIYPPVNIIDFHVKKRDINSEEYYVTCSRLVQYKRVDLLIKAFNILRKNLLVIGDGPELNKLNKLCGPTAKMLGFQKSEEILKIYQNATAFVYAAEEDFGISPIEAQACGIPVIALNKGGTAETIINLDKEFPTGVLYDNQTCGDIVNAVHKFEKNRSKILAESCRNNSQNYSTEKFKELISSFIMSKATN